MRFFSFTVLCGRWETYPREFAKCRRCRKAKYCGKECQSTAWSEGHRFWCSAKEGDEDADPADSAAIAVDVPVLPGAGGGGGGTVTVTSGASMATVNGRMERRMERERERHVRERVLANATGQDTTQAARSAVATLRAAANAANVPTMAPGEHHAIFSGTQALPPPAPPPPHILANRAVAAARQATLIRNLHLYGRPATGTGRTTDVDTPPHLAPSRHREALYHYHNSRAALPSLNAEPIGGRRRAETVTGALMDTSEGPRVVSVAVGLNRDGEPGPSLRGRRRVGADGGGGYGQNQDDMVVE
jgi:hypothetical protein